MEFPLYDILPFYLKGHAYDTDGYSYVSVSHKNVSWLRGILDKLGHSNVRVRSR
jgi:hypothetical protein